jgi:hypothetical protein
MKIPTRAPALRTLGSLLLLLASLASPAIAGEDFERWYSVQMAGQPAGHMHVRQNSEGDHIVTRSSITIRMGRADAGVSISMEGKFVETRSGTPVSMESSQRLGNTPMTTRYTFTPEGVIVESEQAGQTTRTERPIPEGTWLTPAAAAQFVRQRLAAGAQEIVLRTLDPMSGAEPTTTTRKAITRTPLEVQGRTVEVYRCVSTSSAAPGVESTEYLDDNGIAVQAETRLGGIVMLLQVAGPEVAAAGGDGPELMVRTFVKPRGAIPRPRETRRAVYTLSVPSGEMPTLPETGSQRVEVVGERSVRVEVARDDLSPAPEGDQGLQAYRAASPMLNSEDPEIARLAAEAVREAPDDAASRAEAMRVFVHKYIDQKDLGVGFASASEVARDRQGDCTEHAMLLAAMLRAEGIPSRVVSGLIFADQFAGQRRIFGYHMWTQALVERDGALTWVDLDATLGRRGYDATHIALATSPMAEGETTTSLTSLVPLLGRLQIKVESVER